MKKNVYTNFTSLNDSIKFQLLDFKFYQDLTLYIISTITEKAMID